MCTAAKREKQDEEAKASYNQLHLGLQCLVNCTCEKGTSAIVSAPPIDGDGFDLSKGTFHDALYLKYGCVLLTCGSDLSAC